MKKQTDYFTPVNIDSDGTIEMLDYSFEEDQFKGLTGTRFEPISKAEYKERMRKDNVIEYLMDCGIELPNEYKKGGFNALYKAMKDNDEIESFIFDLSYQEHWNKLREIGYPETKYPIFSCVGGGRVFDKNSKFSLRPDLQHLVNEFES